MDNTQECAAPQRKRHRFRRWILLALALALAAWFGRFAYLRLTLRPTPRLAYWEAKVAALDPVPPGAVPAIKAVVAITAPPWIGDPELIALQGFHPQQLLVGEWTASRPDYAVADRIFRTAEFNDARREILQCLEAGWQEPIELDPTSFSGDLHGYRMMGLWLLAHARWVQTQAPREQSPGGDPGAAVEDWMAILRLTRQIRRRQTTIPMLVANSMTDHLATEMRLTARAGTLAPDTRDLAARIERIIGAPLGPRKLLEGDRLAALCQMEFLFVREGGQWLDVSETARLYWRLLTGTNTPQAPPRLWNLASPLFHDLPEATRRVERIWAELEGCVDLVACKRVEASIDSNKQLRLTALDGWPHPDLGDYIPMSVRVVKGYYAARCSLEAALTMFALEAFHRQHGRYPDSLSELVPQYLPRMPLDYADRQPLRYRRTGEDYLLYSIGADGRDDGGKLGHKPNPDPFDTSDEDVVFNRIERKAWRG